MYISLRKAAALQKEILAAVPSITDAVSVSIYSETPIMDIVNHEKAMLEAIALRGRLIRALEEIRIVTAYINMTSGVHSLVTRIAFVDKEISFLSGLVNANTRKSDAVIQGKIERALASDSSHYNFQEELVLSVFSERVVAPFRSSLAAMKKEKVKIQDELLELNIKNSIGLSEETVSVLTEAGLL
jgi:hypothetical protein